jgi:endonuclease/exonuclease/phosphatase family metal-dependent hydrolase
MTWNLLNYPSVSNLSADTALRNPYYRTVIQYVNPDIMVTQENAAANSVSMFLNYVMNAGASNQYSAGTFINGYDSDNGIFYRTFDYQFISNTAIHTDLRDINQFKLVHLLTGDTIRIYSCHLKASYGVTYEAQRAQEIDSLRKVTNGSPAGTDFIVCGDFNIYSTYEPAYNKLLQNNATDDGNFMDAYSMPGTWNDPAYSFYHTQSTRLSSFGGGASGGMNDRFDMILYSTAVSQPGKITYVAGSMTPVGNDGMHYNLSINNPANTIVPANIADALYNVSDHLPVTAQFAFTSTTSVAEISNTDPSVKIFPDPVTENMYVRIYVAERAEVNISIYTLSGTLVKTIPCGEKDKGVLTKEVDHLNELGPGIYFVKILCGNNTLYKRIAITSPF